jgi:hypothetical protein
MSSGRDNVDGTADGGERQWLELTAEAFYVAFLKKVNVG